MIKLIRNIKWFGIFMANQFILTVGICTFVKYTRTCLISYFTVLIRMFPKEKVTQATPCLLYPYVLACLYLSHLITQAPPLVSLTSTATANH